MAIKLYGPFASRKQVDPKPLVRYNHEFDDGDISLSMGEISQISLNITRVNALYA